MLIDLNRNQDGKFSKKRSINVRNAVNPINLPAMLETKTGFGRPPKCTRKLLAIGCSRSALGQQGRYPASGLLVRKLPCRKQDKGRLCCKWYLLALLPQISGFLAADGIKFRPANTSKPGPSTAWTLLPQTASAPLLCCKWHPFLCCRWQRLLCYK